MIPKSQYTVKYTAGDEYRVVGELTPYVGYYIHTNDNQFFVGDDGFSPGSSLIPILQEPSQNPKNPNPSLNVRIYNLIQNHANRPQNRFLKTTTTPSMMKKYPSETDYQRGFFKRYFTKRVNSITEYKEVEESVYRSITNRQGGYDYNLYEAGDIIWYLTGNVYKENAFSLKKAENEFPNISYLFPILDEFFRPDTLSLQQNLHTEGGELYTADGEEYIGDYHIHPSQGPMVGAVHTDNPHSKLYYINQLPSPQGTTYEEFLQSQQTSTGNTMPYMPLKDVDDDKVPFSEQPLTSNALYNKSYNCVVNWVDPGSEYIGLTNNQGLIPGGSSCIDPGNGTGLYKFSEYGKTAFQKCEENCKAVRIKADINIGCLYYFDPNYCSECDTHNDDMCALTYYRYQAEGTCFCGNYGGRKFYAAPCCWNSEGGPQDFDPTTIPGVGPSY
jgi:hypothetical protein